MLVPTRFPDDPVAWYIGATLRQDRPALAKFRRHAAASLSRLQASPLLLCLVCVTPLVTAVSGIARAEGEDAAALEKVTKLNKKAVDEYQNLNFEESRKALKSGARRLRPVGAGEPSGHGAHLHPPRHRHLHGLQAARRRGRPVPQGAEDPGRHQAGQDPGHPGGAGGVRRGGRRAEGADSKPPTPDVKPGEGVEHTPVTRSPQGADDRHQGDRRSRRGREEGPAVVQRRRRRRLRGARDEGRPAGERLLGRRDPGVRDAGRGRQLLHRGATAKTTSCSGPRGRSSGR